MPEDKKGFIATLRDRWEQFRTAGRSGKPIPKKVPRTPRTFDRKALRPKMNPEQEAATASAREKSPSKGRAKKVPFVGPPQPKMAKRAKRAKPSRKAGRSYGR